MNRLTALLIAALLWAGIYLPGLGSTELKGEEARRIMPAVTMLETGDWVVPMVGGKANHRKPPLVQWCIAGSMKLFGKTEFAARLPSALSVLALAVVMIVATRGWLNAGQSLLSAIMMMTQICMIEKCRLAEIEAVYVAMSGIALVLWMSWWVRGKSPWLLWTVPMLFNGLALLAKAPLHLAFFYAIVVATLIAAKQTRRLFSPAHFVGVLLMLAVFAAWALLYFQRQEFNAVMEVWQRQSTGRVTGAEFELGRWLLNLPKGIANHLPWILFAPLLWRKLPGGISESESAMIRGGRWAIAGCFVVTLLIPGMLPRYMQPLAIPFALLLVPVMWDLPERLKTIFRRILKSLGGLFFSVAIATPFFMATIIKGDLPKLSLIVPVTMAILAVLVWAGYVCTQSRMQELLHLTLWCGGIFCCLMFFYAIAVVPILRSRENVRPFATEVDAALPAGAQVVAYGVDDYPPLLATLFYLKHPFVYAPVADDIPKDAQYFLLREKDRKKLDGKWEIKTGLATSEGEMSSILVQAIPRKD